MARADDSPDTSENAEALIAGIQEDGRGEAARIEREAEEEAHRRVSLAKQQASATLKGAKDQAEEQAEAVRKRILAGAAMEKRRRRMRIQEEIFNEVLERTRKELERRRADAQYREVLAGLLTEAAMGLDARNAQVRTPEADRRFIDDPMLREAEHRVQRLGGGTVHLSLSDEVMPYGQGVLLVSQDHRRAFDNLMETRIRRQLSAIRDMVSARFFR